MKIISSFKDYYDEASTKNQSYIYNRETIHEELDPSKYIYVLAYSRIGTGMYNSALIHLDNRLNQTSRQTKILITPVIIGIGGKLFYYTKYENSLLSINKPFFDYESLKPYHKSLLIEKNYYNYSNNLLKGYCYSQFKCVNFKMYIKDGILHLIKEPNLSELGLSNFLSPEDCYRQMDYFFKNKVESNKKYKTNKIRLDKKNNR